MTRSNLDSSSMDWTRCIICQQSTSEQLSCPQLTSKYDPLTVYENFLLNVEEFKKFDKVPVELSFVGEWSAETFMKNNALWHRSCHQKFNNSKLERERNRKRKLEASTAHEGEERCRLKRRPPYSQLCLFCEEEKAERLHEYRTLNADKSLRRMATEMQDTEVLAKISGGDLVAIEAKYHVLCLVKYRNKYRSFLRQHHSPKDWSRERHKARAFTELVAYIEALIEEESYLFKLSELHQLYQQRLNDLGEDIASNKTRLKDMLLQHFSEMGVQEQSDGKNTVLVFPEGMQHMLRDALDLNNYNSENLLFAKVAKMCREELLSVNSQFSGSFPSNCQQGITPITNFLMSMILYGPNIKGDIEYSQPCLTISQLLLYNCKSRGKNSSHHSRHSLNREPPLPLYIGLNIHTRTRSRVLIEQLAKLGVSVPYDRVCQIENHIAVSVSEQFKVDEIVCPTMLRKGIFTVAALDNIDHNPSSTTAKGSFHGTGISITQFPTKENEGTSRGTSMCLPMPSSQKVSLPESFTCVPAIYLNQTPSVPDVLTSTTEFSGNLEPAKAKENCWIEHALPLLPLNILKDQAISWAAYHASVQPKMLDPSAITALLPLFLEKADSPAMVKHGLDLVKGITDFLNPGQIPVLACDCPIFILCKKIQWNFPQTHGEDKFLIMFGGLHVEKTLWTALGKILDGSSWTEILTEAEIATSGIVDSFLKASHITRTRHVHQVSALALSKLQKDAFLSENTDLPDQESFERWRVTMTETSPTFKYWDMVLRIEIQILIFIRAHREKDFPLYVEALENLMFLFFAMDHYNYSRWISVHLRDMTSLPVKLKDDFSKFWAVSKTKNRFSAIPIDQVHEQENSKVKGKGGVVGITDNPTALCQWAIAGPEQARLITQFEKEYLTDQEDTKIEYQHHEEGISSQERFQHQVNSLLHVFIELGNPFEEKCSELLVLHTRECADDAVVDSINKLEAIGTAQYQKFKKEVLKEKSKTIHDTIKKNSFQLFSTSQTKLKSNQAKKLKSARHDVSLFGRLYISNQHRDGDPDVFFSHENQPYPPSLSDFGKLRLGTKSDLLKELMGTDVHLRPDIFDCLIVDGGAIVHILGRSYVQTFAEYADKVFLAFMKRQLQELARIDVVWDRYLPGSIKDGTRRKRGSGIRVKVGPQAKIPPNWKAFLCDSKNKEELFDFLSDEVSKTEWPESKGVYITKGTFVVCKGNSQPMLECTHEEADTRVVVHIMHSLTNGCRRIEVCTVDTDIVVILIGKFFDMQLHYPEIELWVAFGVGKHFRYIHINSICIKLGKDISRSLPIFHAFSGCDTTSCFNGIGKRRALQAWKNFPCATESFLHIHENPFESFNCSLEHFQNLERLTVVMYDKTSLQQSINATRRELFTKKARSLENLPPTQNSLMEHIKRVAYQSGIWTTSDETQPTIPSAQNWGWKWKDSWEPVWMTIPEAAKACKDLIRCSCKAARGCTRCKCFKADLPCTDLCTCNCEK